MLALLQRVTKAKIDVDDTPIAQINQGILVFLGITKQDNTSNADKILEKILHYRIFEDDQGKMNLNLKDIKGELLIVPQFTLAADTKKGTRPGFSTARTPEEAEPLFDYLVNKAREQYPLVANGKFGAHMEIHLLNSGPVTFLLET